MQRKQWEGQSQGSEECRVQRQGGEGGQGQDQDHGTGRNAGDDYDEICWKIGPRPSPHYPHQDENLSQKRGRGELVEDQVHLAPPLLVACARVAKSHLQIESG